MKSINATSELGIEWTYVKIRHLLTTRRGVLDWSDSEEEEEEEWKLQQLLC